MYEESSDARNTKLGAISSGCPARPSGTSEPNVSTSLAGNVDGMSGVQTGPGATPLTRMHLSASACDSEHEKERENVCPKCPLKLLFGNSFNRILRVLFGRVVYNDIDSAKFLYSLRNSFSAKFFLTDIAFN